VLVSGSDDRVVMNIRTLAELTTVNEQTRRFTSLGFATGGMLSPEDAAEFQQQCIASADLADNVPESTRRSFERLRTLHSYGVLCYDAFTVAGDLSWVVLEQALRERFVAFYGGDVPLVARDGSASTFTASDFAALAEAARHKGSWVRGSTLALSRGGDMRVPLTLAPLLMWARKEGLLEGQRNRRVEAKLFHEIRNRFAHGADYHLGMPNDSARRICDLAELINRLWGTPTPGGRLYPAPLKREVVAVAWSPGWGASRSGSSATVMSRDQLVQFEEDPGDWTYIMLRAVGSDPELMKFDARYELTAYPAELLWGPCGRHEAMTWLTQATPPDDDQTYLDRIFAIRCEPRRVFLPVRPEVLLSLPGDDQGGSWRLVRADFASDAFAHVRHAGAQSCRSDRYGGCPVEEVAEGSWQDICVEATTLCPGLQAATYSDVHVPRHTPSADWVAV
jgi:hypothetical protein